jgi:hypothetical protein
MKRTILISAVILLLGFTSAHAQSRPFGLGLMFGAPTGLSAKYWIDDTQGIAGGAAWSFFYAGYFRIHADYLRHFYLIDVPSGKFPLYVGAGARFGFGNDFRLGARIPVGLEYIFKDENLDLFFELVPGMDFVPGTDFLMEGALGIRYYF